MGSKAPRARSSTTARRTSSMVPERRTRGIAPPRAGGAMALSALALRVPARSALHAAFLVHELLPTLRALRVEAFPDHRLDVAGLLLQLDVRLHGPAELVERFHGRLDAGLLRPEVTLDRLRIRVGGRGHAGPRARRGPRAAGPPR